MKTSAFILVLLIAFLTTTFGQRDTKNCGSITLEQAFYQGRATQDWECFNFKMLREVNAFLALQVQQGINPTTSILGIAENDDLTIEQKLDLLCNIFSGISTDLMQTTQPRGIKLNSNLKGTGIVFCEIFRLLQDGIIDNCIQLGAVNTGFVNGWEHRNFFLTSITFRDGEVCQKGKQIILHGQLTNGLIGPTFCNIPDQFRPTFEVELMTVGHKTGQGFGPVKVRIQPDGNISYSAISGSPITGLMNLTQDWVSLDGLFYYK